MAGRPIEVLQPSWRSSTGPPSAPRSPPTTCMAARPIGLLAATLALGCSPGGAPAPAPSLTVASAPALGSATTSAGSPGGASSAPPPPARRPYRAIAASNFRTCVLDADHVITCWGVPDDDDRREPIDVRYRIVPPGGPVRALAVAEDLIYVLSETGSLHVLSPPWPRPSWDHAPRPAGTLELPGAFAWMRVRQRDNDWSSGGCARRLSPPGVICWMASSERAGVEWRVRTYPEAADARDASPADQRLRVSVIVRADGLGIWDCADTCEAFKSELAVQSFVGACAVAADDSVSCLEQGRMRPFPVFGRVSSLQSIPSARGEFIPLGDGAQHCALGRDGLTRCRVGGALLCGSNLAKTPMARVPCPPAEQDLPRATALAVGDRHACVLSTDGEVFCHGSVSSIGSLDAPSSATAVRVVP
jgi:hypothetical protein